MQDIDPNETQEWLEALEDVIENNGRERAQFLVNQLFLSPYANTIPLESQPSYPGDLKIESRIGAMLRWNATMMVLRAGKVSSELGGHLATYASSSNLYEVGFQHFFKKDDLLFIQGHSSPGIYARAFLEGRLTETQMDHFRREIGGKGISSYPHPWLMPDFWQFPTVSMGLGPLQAIYQARFLKYLHNRGLADTSNRKVWAFLGDGETDEPESLGALSIAAREGLDNLIFVVNCNLQRLDGPVRGNSKIIQELEGVFKGAQWNVIKVVWGSEWDEILANDTNGLLKKRLMDIVDGEYQNYAVKDGAFIRENLFNTPELKAMVAHLSDAELKSMRRGGLDPIKTYAAYESAVNHTGSPTVILAKTVKGYGMGSAAGEAMNTTHNQKKMTDDALKAFRDRWEIPLSDDEISKLSFYHPGKNSPEIKYILENRKKLGGYLPSRRTVSTVKLTAPALSELKPLLESSGEREISTTMAFVRLINILMKDKKIGKNIVPIIPDESRTFGMEGMFRQYGIYSPVGQLYTPVDRDQVMYYKESKDGQLLEEGINEAGAFCSWMAAGSSYSVSNLPMIPFYIYYSMFGFQRIGDLAWAAGDMRCKGFLMGGTAGRTTLAGEGLQHQDGHNLLFSATIPNCISYDPTYAYEMAVIVQDGIHRMYEKNEDIYYYLTAMNENYTHPAMPVGAEKGITKGLYLLREAQNPKAKLSVQLLGSGTILREVLAAAEILEKDFEVNANVFSATSFTELRRDALNIERENFLNPEEKPKLAYVTKLLQPYKTPVIAATDYMRAYADQIRAFIPNKYVVLGTDGYGRSDTREALREFFEVNRYYIVVAALKALADEDKILFSKVARAMKTYGISAAKPNPVTV
ncbi:MAG TPA: pyruvate dehydrogenase (acetyl-transferring), homodimeric type [Gammaproteobacteria bacterium]|nr:pyruvate dehydrogenase (acetyl-transferring), homodimeric type [Gammaproteobacteria bacterium]